MTTAASASAKQRRTRLDPGAAAAVRRRLCRLMRAAAASLAFPAPARPALCARRCQLPTLQPQCPTAPHHAAPHLPPAQQRLAQRQAPQAAATAAARAARRRCRRRLCGAGCLPVCAHASRHKQRNVRRAFNSRLRARSRTLLHRNSCDARADAHGACDSGNARAAPANACSMRPPGHDNHSPLALNLAHRRAGLSPPPQATPGTQG